MSYTLQGSASYAPVTAPQSGDVVTAASVATPVISLTNAIAQLRAAQMLPMTTSSATTNYVGVDAVMVDVSSYPQTVVLGKSGSVSYTTVSEQDATQTALSFFGSGSFAATNSATNAVVCTGNNTSLSGRAYWWLSGSSTWGQSRATYLKRVNAAHVSRYGTTERWFVGGLTAAPQVATTTSKFVDWLTGSQFGSTGSTVGVSSIATTANGQYALAACADSPHCVLSTDGGASWMQYAAPFAIHAAHDARGRWVLVGTGSTSVSDSTTSLVWTATTNPASFTLATSTPDGILWATDSSNLWFSDSQGAGWRIVGTAPTFGGITQLKYLPTRGRLVLSNSTKLALSRCTAI